MKKYVRSISRFKYCFDYWIICIFAEENLTLSGPVFNVCGRILTQDRQRRIIYMDNENTISEQEAVERAEARISRLEAERPFNLSGDEKIVYENNIERAKNVIRESQGLEPKQLKLTEAQIKTLIDTGLIEEKLKTMPQGSEKEAVKLKVRDIQLYRQVREDAERREKDFKYEVNNGLKGLKETEPQPYKYDDDGKTRLAVNPYFDQWAENLLKIEDKVDHKIKSYTHTNREVPKYLYKMKEEIADLKQGK